MSAEEDFTEEERVWLARLVRRAERRERRNFRKLREQEPSDRRDYLLPIVQRKLAVLTRIAAKTSTWDERDEDVRYENDAQRRRLCG